MKNISKRKVTKMEENDNSDFYDQSNSDSEWSDEDKLYKKCKSKKNKKLLDEIKQEIQKTEPDIIIFLNENLLMTDRVKLLQLYEIYKTTEVNTESWLNLRDNINNFFEESKNKYKQYNKYTLQQHENMKKEIHILESYCPDSNFIYKILELKTSIENKQIIYNKYKEFNKMCNSDDEKGKLKNWLNWAISLPYDSIKIFSLDSNELTNVLKQLSTNLNEELYGMKNVKEQILLFVSSKLQNPHMKKCSLGLLGAPGVGKTHISRLLANLLNFPFEQICLGGISNSDFLKGHDYTYVGSQPGEIVKCLKRMLFKNGIIFFDEFDKISHNNEICSSLLHITDPIQNSNFKDNFLSEISLDLSNIWFIYSMNKLPSDNALNDRIYTIEIPSYNEDDKISIVIKYLFPKALKNINKSYTKKNIIITQQVAKYLVSKTNHEDQGVRPLEKIVYDIVTKIDFIIKYQDKKGNLFPFDVSFNLGIFIKYPINLTVSMIDIFLK